MNSGTSKPVRYARHPGRTPGTVPAGRAKPGDDQDPFIGFHGCASGNVMLERTNRRDAHTRPAAITRDPPDVPARPIIPGPRSSRVTLVIVCVHHSL